MAVETIISSVFCTLFGILFAKFSYMNLRGKSLGKEGRRFIFEMDEVMGGLMGIPRFSLLEGSVLALGSLGTFLAWSNNPTMQTLTVLGLVLLAVYMVVCSIYSIVAKQPILPYLIISSLLVGLIVWRALRMMPSESLVTVGIVAGIATLLCIFSGIQMHKKADSQADKIAKLIAINAYLKDNNDWDWREGESAPVGFEESH